MDATGYSNFPLGAKQLDAETLEAFASKYRAARADRARLGAARVRASDVGFAKPQDGVRPDGTCSAAGRSPQCTGCGSSASATGPGSTCPPNPNKDQPVGGAAIIQLGPDEFLRRRIGRPPRASRSTSRRRATTSQFLSVEEGTFENGRWVMTRRWNGDQTDYGLNLTQRRPCSRCGWGPTADEDVHATLRRHRRCAACASSAGARAEPGSGPTTGIIVTPDARAREGGAPAGLWRRHHPRHRRRPSADFDRRQSLMVTAKPLSERLHRQRSAGHGDAHDAEGLGRRRSRDRQRQLPQCRAARSCSPKAARPPSRRRRAEGQPFLVDQRSSSTAAPTRASTASASTRTGR